MRRKFAIFPCNQILGEQLRKLREVKSLSPLDFCKKVNVTTGQLEKYEKGIDMIPLSTLEIFEEKLGLYLPKKVMRKLSVLRRDVEENNEELSEIYKTIFFLER